MTDDAKGLRTEIMRFDEFRNKVLEEVVVEGSQNKVAKKYGVNQGIISRVINCNEDSPSLRKAMNLPRWPKRIRWIVDTDQKTFDKLSCYAKRYRISRSELLHMMVLVTEEFIVQAIHEGKEK